MLASHVNDSHHLRERAAEIRASTSAVDATDANDTVRRGR
jgi:hypothetical protein